MCRSRVEIEFGGVRRILTLKNNIALTRTNIQRLLIIEVEALVANLNNTCTTYIKYTQLTTSQEIRSLNGVNSLQLQGLRNGHCTAYNHTVIHRIYHIDLIGCKYTLYKEITTQTRCVIRLSIFGVCSIAHFIVCFHYFIFERFSFLHSGYQIKAL